MADIAGVVVNPILEVGKWLAAPIWRQFKYLLNYKTNFDNLQKEVNNLKSARDGIQDDVTAAERNVEEIKQKVKDWQKDVEKTITEAEQLIQAKADNPRCFKGLCPNFIIHYKQSRKALKLKRDGIDRLLQKEKELSPISKPTNPPDRRFIPDEDYLTFESRNSLEKNVRDALNDKNVYMIGVYGMGGLGKTTLVEELGRKAKKDELFEDIVFVEVSESPDVKKIQTTIANKLGLKFENENESEMGDKIYSRMKDKNILVILDNIWEPLELDKTVGIPRRADRGRNKLLFTTRNLDVLERMGSTNNFGMGILNEEEAWTLFTKMTGNIIQKRELHSLAKDVCKECKGLPIVICTTAKALQNKSRPFDWKYALQELGAKDYMKIALSYKYLRDDELKKTFLISSLMENNTFISDLFRHVVCLDILDKANLTMEEARDRLDKLVCDLKDACLLLDGFESGQFAMHDVVRAAAIRIAYMDHHVFTTRNDIERDWKDKDKLEKCTKISLSGKGTIISQLWPNDLNCPNLEYFYMTDMWDSSFEIPENFFTVMPKLRVLNLFGLRQSSLPSSIHCLTNLQTLCLDYSQLEGVPIIGKLNKLKILSLQRAYIKEFPMEIGQLTQLRLLDLNYCRQLKVIAPNVISKLSNLEELYLKECPIQWKIEVLEELKLLSNLVRVELDIQDDKVLPEAFFSRELIRYKILVGNWPYRYLPIGEYKCLRILKLIINPTIYLEELCGIKNVEILCLVEYLDDCGHSKFSLPSNEITPLFNKKVIFPELMVLVLMNIISRKIWDNQLPSTSFQNLKELILWRCTKIKFVFPYTITKNLQQLQYLEIKDCIDLEEIVATEEITEAAASFVFPEVTFLKLSNLPELATFYAGIHTLECPKLKKLVVKNCDKFKMLNSDANSLCLDQKVHFRDLEVLELKNISFERIWDSQLSTSSYQNLTHLTLYRCNKIKYVFPLSMVKSLQQLQCLKLMSCEVLERIVAPEEGTKAVVNFSFPQVSTVKLQYLPEFTDFYPGIHTSEWPKLKKLVVDDCGKFKMLTSEPNFLCFDQKINHDLEIFQVEDRGEQISWWSKHLYIFYYESTPIPLWLLQRFKNLTCLFVNSCYELVNLTTLSTARSLVQLRELKISYCEMLMEILEIEEDATTEIVFENLNKLSFEHMKNLTCFYSGNYTFNFHSLEELNITDCPNMKTFCRGILSTPKLQKIGYEGMEAENEGNDLNKTIQRLYKKENQDISLDLNFKCKAFQHDNSTEIDYNQYSTSFYHNLTHLFLWKCENIKYVFPSSIAKILHQLQELKIQNCKVLKEIIAKEEGANAVVDFVFPNITLLKFEDLPELTAFYPGIYTLEMPKLKELVVNDCTKYVSLKENNVETELNILAPESIFLDNKINHDLEIFQLENGWEEISWWSQSKELKISHYKSAPIPLCLLQRFQNLTCLLVYDCHELVNLTTASIARSLVQLRELKISYCEMLMEILEIEEDATTEIVFENLNKLSFDQMKNLTCFCSGNYTFNFRSLEELNIAKCPNIKTFCRGILSTPKLQKINYEKMEVEIEENDLNKTIQELYKKENMYVFN